GTAYGQNERLEQAISCYRQALAMQPDDFEIRLDLGVVCGMDDHPEEAIHHFEQCWKMRPDDARSCIALSDAYVSVGRFDEAIAISRSYLARFPDHETVHSNLIIYMDHTPSLEDAEIQAERKAWGRRFCPVLTARKPLANSPDPQRKLKIGYVSSYFHNHSAANAFAAPMVHHDPEHYETFAYQTLVGSGDFVTDIFKSRTTHWREVERLSDDQLEALIRQDGIDILVDLMGHAGHNRLRIFARRPAPVSVSAWGYDHGTGLEAMDYLFSDPLAIPPESRCHFAEEIYDLPCGIHLMPFLTMPKAGPLPALKNGYLTLGVFARSNKISQPMIPMWAEILRQIPESRLFLKLSQRNMDYFRPMLTERFVNEGIDPARIRVEGWTPQRAHFKLYREIDFQLDTYPTGAAVTGLESLRMGVPLVSLYGANHASRYTASFMHNLGVEGWVATTREAYVERAVERAADLPALAALRASLRERFDASLLGDHLSYARAVEAAYRQMWHRWCAEQGTVS
ncbi:MAG: tetratricopeptide repeat protein, partial [Magnetococcales bacterium]|nr:tetratricopeptide repeat protein [Magnetococcales bacterium]